MDTQIGEANAVLCGALSLCGQNGIFQTPQSYQFLYRSLLRSLPMAMVMNLG